MESPTAFLWSAFVTNFGLRVSPYVRFASQQPRLFTCNIGESATTRKSTASDVVNEFFEAALKGASVRPARLVDGFGSIEGALKLMARYKKGESDEVYTPPPTLFYLDELDPLMKRSSMPGSLGQAPLHRFFNGNSYTYPTLGNELEINDAYIAILSNATNCPASITFSG